MQSIGVTFIKLCGMTKVVDSENSEPTCKATVRPVSAVFENIACMQRR